MQIKCKVAWISDRLREFGSQLFLKKESLQATLQKNGQNRNSCDSDSRSQHNPIVNILAKKSCDISDIPGIGNLKCES